jgi:outer membrane receptor protein involved in Fe transport
MTKFLLGSSALALCALSAPLHAQQVSEEAYEEEITEFDEGLEPRTDVIIVTANRRAQDVQDVQIAVTAVDATTLARQGVETIQEVTQVAPSFTSSQAQVASGSVVLRIRGIGTTSNNIGFESAVGIFIDGAYQSRPGVALNEFVDIERVEVLRGPQGTLFGRNTSAGALNIVTNRPNLNEFGGFANASYGNFDEISVQGAVNAPIIEDTAAVRLTGAFRQRDGFITLVDETGTPFDDSNDVDQWLVRGQLGFETDGGLRGRLIGDYSKSTSSCCSPIELFQSPLVTAGAFAAVGLGPTGGNFQDTVATNPFDQGTFEQALDDRIASANFAPEGDFDNYGVTGEIEFPVSDNADLIFIGSWRNFSYFERYDSDFTALDIFNVEGIDGSIETLTAELRLQGEAMDGRWNYVFGGYYSDEDIEQEVSFALGEDYGELVGALLFPATGGALGANPLTVFTGVDPAGTTNTNLFTQDAQSYSVFTNNSFEIFDGFEVTLGARYSWEEKEGAFEQTAVNNQICPATLNAIGGGVVPQALIGPFIALGCFGFTAPVDLPQAAVFPLPQTFDADFSDEELIWTAKLGYQFPSDINVYASFTHGYKAGGINLDTTAAVGGADPTFLSEEVDAYEVGLKSRLLDGAVTLNVAGFHQEFSNFQVLEFTGTAFQTFNVPEALTTGVEVETFIRASDYLTVNGGLTVMDARYPDDCAGDNTSVIVLSLCGNKVTNASDVVAVLGANYERDINADWDFFVAGQVRLESDQRTSTQAIVPPGAAEIAAFGGDVQAAIDAAPLIVADVQDGSAFVNARVGFGRVDDAFQIEFFVNNLTDQVVRGVTFNTTLRGSGAANSRSAFSLQPRTYGVTVRTAF